MATVEIPDVVMPDGHKLEVVEFTQGDKVTVVLEFVPLTKWIDARLTDLETAPRRARFRDHDSQEWIDETLRGVFACGDGSYRWRDDGDACWNYGQVEVPDEFHQVDVSDE